MNNLYLIMLIGSIVAVAGTLIGSFIAIFVRNPSNKTLGWLIGFSGGLMLAVVVFDLIPEALSKWNFVYTIICCIMGIITVAFIDKKTGEKKINKHAKIAFITAIGLMMHNLPEGIIMGCGFATGGMLGIKMSIIIALHDIPEGLAVAAPLMASKTKVLKIIIYTFLTAVPTVFGYLFGLYIGNISESALGISLSFASGIMLYVVCGEMMPESNKLWEGITTTFGILLGIIIGLAIITVL